ncbi:MAG TPA: monovalent cation/H(+) antiporter subunit G [Candidatus Binatia bacterium]|nr:monovalent cation/H(+) antiporter subunit G [Candidatus Binatia bacterium]
MNEILSSVLMLIGATFALLAGAGVLRMPDLFTRMQAATKASTLGIGCIILAVAVHFGELGITTRALATVIFVFLTAPVAAHMIARAAYFVGVPLWDQTIIDELHGHYDRRTHKLARPDDPLATLPMSVDLKRLTGQTVLVGYGRVGRRIGEALIANDVSIVVVEDNREIVEVLREKNVPAVFGNASEPGVLIQAHIHKASMLVIATPDSAEARRMARIARAVNPRIEIVVRTHSEEEAALLEKEISGKVFMGEHELAIAATRYVLGRYAVGADNDT